VNPRTWRPAEGFGSGVAWRYFLYSVALSVFLLLGLTAGFLHVWRVTLDDEVDTRGRGLALRLARDAQLSVFTGDSGYVDSIARATLREPSVAYVAIYTMKGQALVRVQGPGVKPPTPQPAGSLAAVRQADGLDGEAYREFLQPVISPTTVEADEEALWNDVPRRVPVQRIGSVVLGISGDYVRERMTSAVSTVLMLLPAGLAAAAVLSWATARRMTEPIRALTDQARRMRDDHVWSNVVVTSRDEIGELAATLNEMSRALRGREEELREAAASLERRVAERTREISAVNADLEDFNYVISHDLKEPLRSIAGFAAILEEDSGERLDEESRDHLDRIRRSAERAQVLIGDLLKLSRVGRSELPREPVDVAEVLDGVRQDLAGLLQGRDARLVVEGTMPVVRGSSAHLREVFQNLVSNGLKFNRSPQPTVTVRSFPVDDGTCFSVQDNGIGIDRQYHDKIFRVFTRLHTREEYEGTGAGLAIVKKIVEKHGGRVWVDSSQGQGATFFFTVPGPTGTEA
jgi:signal transduction histidine kinase